MFSNENGLFRETKRSKYLPNIFLAIILVFVFAIAGQILGGILGSVFMQFIKTPSVKLLLTLVFNDIFIMLIIFAWVKFLEKRNISSLGFKKDSFIKKYFIGFIIGFIMFAIVILILTITGNITVNAKSNYVVGLGALGSVLIVLPGWAIQSATEEILSRGWLMNVIGAKYNAALGLVVSSVLFGLLHLFNDEVSILAIINICLVGIFFGLYVIKTDDLWGACGVHCAWNWAQGNIFGLEVSGNQVEIGSLVDLSLTGNKIFTGGKFGPEAGLATTIVLLIGIVILFIRIKKENR